MPEYDAKVTADVRQATLGFLGQRLIESALRRDLGVDSKKRRHFNSERHLQIYDIAERRPVARSTRMGDVKVEWIRSYKEEAMKLITEQVARVDKLRPRNPNALATARAILEESDDQLRSRGLRHVKEYYREKAPLETDESLPAGPDFELYDAKAALASLPRETLQQMLISTECLNQFGFVSHLQSHVWSQKAEEDVIWMDRWSWPGAVRDAVHLLEFQDRQAEVVAQLFHVLETSKTRPDFLVLEYRMLGRVKVLQQAYIYEAKTGNAVLTVNQEHALFLCSTTTHVEYRIVHVTAEHVIPKTVKIRTFSSKDRLA